MSKLTPSMKQYFEAKSKHPEAVLFFRMGDFYEMFYEDAEKVAPILDIALTSRNKNSENPIPMCGVPYHSAENYINRLASMGIKVSVCEQVEDPSKAKGLVAREVTRLVTPSTILSAEGQVPAQPRFLVAIAQGQKNDWGLAGLEVSTGDLFLGRFEQLEALRGELLALDPHECLLPPAPSDELLFLTKELNLYVSETLEENFMVEHALNALEKIFDHHQIDGWGLKEWPLALSAAGAVLNYAEEICGGVLKHLAPPRLLWEHPYLGLDEAAIRNLELLRSLRDGGVKGTLLEIIDKTQTAMGARLLRTWLVRPLINIEEIKLRQGAVESLLRDGLKRIELINLLKKLYDLDRSLARLALNRGSARDLSLIRDSLALIPEFKRALTLNSSAHLEKLGKCLNPLTELYETLESSLVENLPANSKEGGFIKALVSEELDELISLETNVKKHIAALENREKERTGISTLKIGFNRVFGYYLEVSKSNVLSVPEDWIRKQTIVNGERYITPELKELEEKILTAGEKRIALEESILNSLKELCVREAKAIKEQSLLLSEIDVLTAFSICAETYDWVKAEISNEDIIEIKGGRHPVVEQSLPLGEAFVSNDIKLNVKERILIITGPNMAGKSTILRQTALIVLLNQMGSFVPAESANLSIRDKIFTRVGAADDLTKGRSTFMVEMNETARILALATPRSLVVLDEIGRGTSTFDGLSIAWSVAEYLHDLDGLGVPTLFATHYHELVELAKTKSRVKNYNVAVKSWKGKIVFLRRLTPGGASKSHGLAVAALAGIPQKVIDRAEEVLSDLSKQSLNKAIKPSIRQFELFDEQIEPQKNIDQLRIKLREISPENITPIEALNILSELSIMVKNEL